jgi:cullin 1
MRARRNVSVERVWMELGTMMQQVLAYERTCEATRVVELVYRLCTCEPPQSVALQERVHALIATHCARVGTRISSLHEYASEWATFTKGASALNVLAAHLNAELALVSPSTSSNSSFSTTSTSAATSSCTHALASSPVGLDALQLWHSVVFVPHEAMLLAESAVFVKQMRDGALVGASASDALLRLSAFVASLTALGAALVDSAPRSLYTRAFEDAYVRETAAYYARESVEYLGDNGVVAYMLRAKQRLDEEAARARTVLDPRSIDRAIAVLDTALVTAHAGVIGIATADALLRGDHATLALGVFLVGRLQGGLAELCARLEHVGAREATGALAAIAAAQRSDARAFAETMIGVVKRFDATLRAALGGAAAAAEREAVGSALERGYRGVVNRHNVADAFAQAAAPGDAAQLPRAPELLAKYSNFLLSKGAHKAGDGSELDAALAGMIQLFKLADDKDVFQKFYARLLAKRLVTDSSVSDDAEKQVLGDLRSACGFEYTAKLQRMFQDIGTSRDINNAFNEWRAGGGDAAIAYDVSMLVLTAGAWPISASASKYAVPVVVERSEALFREFYALQHSGRRLTWLYNFCKAELRTRCWSRRYELTVTAFQMSVLLLFNEADAVALDEVATMTSLAPAEAQSAVRALIAAQILATSKRGGDDDDNDGTTERLVINKSLKSKRLRIRVAAQSAAAEKQDSSATRESVTADRKLVLQAAIVRVMKARKSLAFQRLVGEVLEHVAERFRAPVPLVKMAIEQLVEKEFLRRDEKEPTLFHYIS